MAELDYEYLADLVVKTQQGSSDAFAELYAATYKKLYHFAYHYLKDTYLAQDIIQEVYILVLKNINKLKEPKLFISWLNQINFRLCFDASQKLKRNSMELGIDKSTAITSTPSDYHCSPEQLLAQKEEDDNLMKQILSLPPKEAQAIIMRYYSEMKIDDIAIAMSCSKSTIKRYLNHGRQRLGQLLDDPKGEMTLE